MAAETDFDGGVKKQKKVWRHLQLSVSDDGETAAATDYGGGVKDLRKKGFWLSECLLVIFLCVYLYSTVQFLYVRTKLKRATDFNQ